MLDQGISPFEGPYALSVLATYRSAVVLQHMLAAYVPSHPTFVARLPYVGKMSLVNGVKIFSISKSKLGLKLNTRNSLSLVSWRVRALHPTLQGLPRLN